MVNQGSNILSDKPFTEQTSAKDIFIAFEYQYYYFLLQILKLKRGESAGMEVLDDVHTVLKNDKQVLVQVKHTVQKTSKGQPINITELDSDLWKTFNNWTKVTSDKKMGRGSIASQLAFIKKTDFLLTSNKSSNECNQVISNIADYKLGKISYKSLNSCIEMLNKNTSDKTIKGYITQVLSLSLRVREAFFLKIDFELDAQFPIELCKEVIREKMIDEQFVDTVFSSLDSNIRQDNFIRIYNGKLLEIDFEEFRKKYRTIFDIARNPNLVITPFNGVLPDNINDQCFIKQLIDIGDIDFDEEEFIYEYTRLKLVIETNIEQWIRGGLLTHEEKDTLKADVITLWKTEFRDLNRPTPASADMESKAKEVLYRLRKQRFQLSKQDLSIETSHGELYSLSDTPVIGWHVNWEEKFT
jgi:hypothetical protein